MLARTIPSIVFLAGLAMAFAADGACADEPFQLGGRWPASAEPVEFARVGIELQARGGVAFPDGLAYDNGSFFGIFGGEVTYAELFRPGALGGFAVYMPIYVGEQATRRVEFALGPFVAFTHARYDGQRADLGGGDTLEADAMDITKGVIGFHVRFRSAPSSNGVRFFAGLQLGLGVAVFDGVDATIVQGGPPQRGALYRRTTTIAFESMLRLGFSTQPAPTLELDWFVFLGVDFVGWPDDADGPANPVPASGAGPVSNALLGLGISVAFRFPRSRSAVAW